ncbi:MAG: DUF302 domain-containing protein [Armatimonadetes bacterium]|nr:DUF302 domain-containing protein [Armatimonadota bacterium]
MSTPQKELGKRVTIHAGHDAAIARATDCLKAEGFGILTSIDVKETMKKKLDIDVAPYTILGACNPPLAHGALTAAPEVGLLLPCNVTVREIHPGFSEVAFIDPRVMLGVVDAAALAPVAEEAAARLGRAAAALRETEDAAV